MAAQGGFLTHRHHLHDDCYADVLWNDPVKGERGVTCGCGRRWVVKAKRPIVVEFRVEEWTREWARE